MATPVDTSLYAAVTLGDIVGRLDSVMAEEGGRLLFAVESGSRAWGFASPDSDWDIRFVHAGPIEDHLGLFDRRDVIERPVDRYGIDLSGWELRKALRLLLSSNPALLEWLQSPIVYHDDGQFRPAVLELFRRYASRRALAHHYRSITRQHVQRDAAGSEVKLKRYFYIVRAVAALDWVVSGNGDLPPMNLAELVSGRPLPLAARRDFDELLAMKTGLPELGTGPRRPALDAYVARVLADADLATVDDRADSRADFARAADRLYRELLGLRSLPVRAEQRGSDMSQTITTGAMALVEQAEREIETVPVDEAIGLVGAADVVLVDLRDPRELERDGRVPGAFHCPRGMLEFWIDPASPYHKPVFQEDKRFVFFCGGGMRSALAAKTAQDMGLKPVAHVAGGFSAWKAAGGPVDTTPKT